MPERSAYFAHTDCFNRDFLAAIYGEHLLGGTMPPNMRFEEFIDRCWELRPRLPLRSSRVLMAVCQMETSR